jgi:hypothetical protein
MKAISHQHVYPVSDGVVWATVSDYKSYIKIQDELFNYVLVERTEIEKKAITERQLYKLQNARLDYVCMFQTLDRKEPFFILYPALLSEQVNNLLSPGSVVEKK